jgi:hypothetical protein
MDNTIALSLNQQFDLERTSRSIDALTDVDGLRAVVKDLLIKWHCERAESRRAVHQQLGTQPPSI